MKFASLMIFISLTTNNYCQTDSIEKETVDLISKTLVLTDLNPMYKTQIDNINTIFKYALEMHLTFKNTSNEQEILEVFRLLYENSFSLYEDSQEERRLKTMRTMCFSSIALMTDLDKSFTFIDYAKFTLFGNTTDSEIELMENQGLGLLLTDVLLKHENKQLNKSDLETVNDFIESNKIMISSEIIQKAKKIINKFEQELQ